jgi:hypothetical protein
MGHTNGKELMVANLDLLLKYFVEPFLHEIDILYS